MLTKLPNIRLNWTVLRVPLTERNEIWNFETVVDAE
jgi:hypothetical protein